MAARFVALYNTPTDPAAFDAHYSTTHVPLVKQYPGLRSFTISKGPVTTPTGPSPYHLVAELEFDSIADMQAAFTSPQGKAVARDVRNFGSAGVVMLMFETEEP